MDNLLQSCTAIIMAYNSKKTLTEFELLVYEQACRFAECLLKNAREGSFDEEFGNYPK